MPPRKTGTTKKPTTRKPAPKKPAAKKPARRSYKKKQQDKKLPIGVLFAVIPTIMLAAFLLLRFSGGEKPPIAPKPPVRKEVVTNTIVKEVETKNLVDSVKLFMFEKSLKIESLTQKDNVINIEASSAEDAKKLTGDLKNFLIMNKFVVDGEKVLTVEDTHGIYNISFTYTEPVVTKQPIEEKPIKQTPVKPAFRAKLAVVIDDCGYSMGLARDLAAVDYPVTFAIIPYTPYGKETAKLAKRAGKTVFLHFPMQPKSYPSFDPGKGALLLNMPETIIAAITKANFEYFPLKLDGTNNHTGSAYTENAEKMRQALTYIKKYTNAFMDSYTSGQSVAYDVCQESGMKCAVNNVFLDNEEPGLVTVNDKINHVHDQLIIAANKALSKGSAIAIGHLKKGTVAALGSSFAQIEKMGVQIVPVTSLMD